MDPTVKSLIENEFHETSPKRIQAIKFAELHGILNENIKVVRGDGKCFIRSLIVYLVTSRNRDACEEIFKPFADLNFERNLLDIIDAKSIDDNSDLMNHLCDNIYKSISDKWDYTVDKQYYLNPNNIDGFALEMVMRLLGVSKVTIYSLVPSANNGLVRSSSNAKPESQVEIVEIVKPIIPNVTTWSARLVCAQGRCHYNIIL